LPRHHARSEWPRTSRQAVGSGGVLAAIAHLHVGQLGMFPAVRLAWLRRIVAEAEAARAWLTDWPAAGHHTPVGARCRRNHAWCRCRFRHHYSHGWHHRRGTRHGCGARKWRQRWPRDPPWCRTPGRAGARSITPDRRWTRRQVEAMCLAHDGVFGNAQPPADLSGGEPFVPQRAKSDYRFFGPLHLVVPPLEQPQDTVYGLLPPSTQV
jgi:hypothetical protein